MADLRTNYSPTSPAGDLPHGDVNDAFGRINALKAKVDGLPASAATPAEVASAIATAKAEILGGAGPAFDTLQELKALFDADDTADDDALAALVVLVGTKQPLDADLTAIAALTTTAFGRSLLTQADAAATLAALGAGSGALQPKRYGLLPGRRVEITVDGTGTTALTSFATTAIPLTTVVSAQGGPTLASNKIVIPDDVPPMKYAIHIQARFQGGTSALRVIQPKRVGDSSELFSRSAIFAGTQQLSGDGDTVLYPGDQIGIESYTETGSVTIVERGFGVGDVRASLRSIDLMPVKSCLVGYFGDEVPGLARAINGGWGLRTTWANLAQGMWNADGNAWIAANPNKAYNFGVGLIPHDGIAASAWNTTLDAVIAGTYDSYYTTLGTNLAAQSPKTLYLRPWWEVDQDTTRANVNSTKFKAAWHRAIPLIRAAFAAAAPTKTLKVVFCYLATSDYGNSMDYYPSDEADVDILGGDIYAWIYGSGVPTWPTLAKAVQKRLDVLAANARAHNKPMGIDEWGTGVITGGGSPGSWGRKDDARLADLYFNWVEQNSPEYILNFNIEGAGSHSLANTPSLAAALKQRHGVLVP